MLSDFAKVIVPAVVTIVVAGAMRLRLATQTANIAAATTTVTTAGTMTFAKSDNTRDVLSRCRGQAPGRAPD